MTHVCIFNTISEKLNRFWEKKKKKTVKFKIFINHSKISEQECERFDYVNISIWREYLRLLFLLNLKLLLFITTNRNNKTKFRDHYDFQILEWSSNALKKNMATDLRYFWAGKITTYCKPRIKLPSVLDNPI